MEKYHPNEEVSLWIGKMLARKRRIKQAPVETYLSPLEYLEQAKPYLSLLEYLEQAKPYLSLLEYLAQPKKPEKIVRKPWVDKEDEIGYVTDEWADNSQPVCSE